MNYKINVESTQTLTSNTIAIMGIINLECFMLEGESNHPSATIKRLGEKKKKKNVFPELIGGVAHNARLLSLEIVSPNGRRTLTYTIIYTYLKVNIY